MTNKSLGGVEMAPTDVQDVILHWDELEWVQLDDSPGLRVCAFSVDPDYSATAVAMDYAAGFTIPDHYHTVAHIEIVVDGEITVSGRAEKPGDLRMVPAGAVYGPLIAGPNGAKVIEVFPNHTIDAVQGRYMAPEIAVNKNSADRNAEVAAKLGLDV
jgi:quercetin dioxygenase-like cupin family protein